MYIEGRFVEEKDVEAYCVGRFCLRGRHTHRHFKALVAVALVAVAPASAGRGLSAARAAAAAAAAALVEPSADCASRGLAAPARACPALWLCGHVQDSYGTQLVNFCVPLPEGPRSSGKPGEPPPKANSAKANSRAARAKAAVSAALADAATGDLGGATPAALPAASALRTLCLNVAVANDGRATGLGVGRGPVVFTIDTRTHEVTLVGEGS
jgi:hypothetical protein